ncbi:hypothetical protein [Streptomyces sp. NPDC001492]
MRVRLPSRDIQLAFPIAVSSTGSQDDSRHHRWLAQRNAHGQTLRAALLLLRDTHGIDVRIHFRALPFTPRAKLYLVNHAEALFSYCWFRGSDAPPWLWVFPAEDGPTGTVR